MADLAALQFPVESAGVVKAAKDLDGLSASAAKAGRATDQFVARVQKTVSAAQQVSASNAAAAHSFDALYDAAQRDFSRQWAAGAATFTRANDNLIGSSKTLRFTMLDLSRQFADVGVSAAMGINPMMILIQQGPQIGDAFLYAKTQGLGFSAVLKEIAASVLPFAAWAVAAAGLAAAVAVLWQEYQNAAEAAKELKKVTDDFAQTQRRSIDAMSSAIEFAGKYHVASDVLWQSLENTLKAQGATNDVVKMGKGATDEMARAARDRAEAERLLTVELLRQAAAQATLRAQEAQKTLDKLMPSQFGTVLRQIGEAAAGLDVTSHAQEVAQAMATPAAQKLQKIISDATAGAKSLSDEADALSKALLTIEVHGPKAGNAAANAFKAAVKAADEFISRLGDEVTKSVLGADAEAKLQVAREIAKAPLDRQKTLIAQLEAEKEAVEKAAKVWAGYDALAKGLPDHMTAVQTAQVKANAAVAQAKVLADGAATAGKANVANVTETASATVEFAKAQETANAELVKTPKDLADMAKELSRSKSGLDEFVDSVDRIVRSLDDLKFGLQNGNWAEAAQGLVGTLQNIGAAFQQNGAMGGLGATASAINAATGGHIGGIAGSALNGIGVFSGLSMAGTALLSAGSMGALGALSGAAKAIGAAIPPLAIIAGLAAAVAPLLGNHQPSNFTASADFGPNGVTFGGDKPNSNTQALIQQLAQAVQTGQQQLQAMGLTLNATVTELAIGQRDTSKIHLSNGQTIEAAAGDPTAAAEAALKAVLRNATFVDSAEQKFVQSMLDAGKGFDDITAAMQTFTQAQQISAGLADQILQLTDPRAFDLQSVTRSIQQQRQAAQQMADQGFLTADQLSVINGQLGTLAGLQIDQVMARYAQSVTDATKAQEDALAAANDNVSAARDALGKAVDAATGPYEQALTQFQSQTDAAKQALSDANQAVSAAQQGVAQAYQRQAGALQDTIDRFTQLAESLGAFNAQLATSTLSPGNQYAAAKRAFLSTSAAAAGGDETALGALQPAVQAFLDASRANAPDRLSYVRDVNQARAAVSRAQAAAQGQASIAEQQLSALTALVSGVIDLGSDGKSVSAAMADLKAAQDRVVTATDAVNGALHDETLVKGVIDAIHTQYDPLVTINASVLTIPEAIAGLQAALQAQAAAQAALDVANASAASAAAQAAADAAAAAQAALGQATQPAPVTAPDTTVPANFDVPSIVAGIVGGGGDLTGAVNGLRSEVSQLRTEQRAANLAIAKNTRQTSDLLDRVTQGDTAIRTTAAA